MNNIWHSIDDDRIKTEDFIVCVEIPKGSKNLDRVLYTSTHYPANYGFIPRTYSQDHDPLDVLVLCSEVLDPLVLVRCYPIGVVKMIDNDEVDEKIIAIPFGDPSYNSYSDISELPVHQFEEIRHFFTVYKQLEDKETSVLEVLGRKEAVKIIDDSLKAYNELYINRN